jgi:hypothetical protein
MFEEVLEDIHIIQTIIKKFSKASSFRKRRSKLSRSSLTISKSSSADGVETPGTVLRFPNRSGDEIAKINMSGEDEGPSDERRE